MELNETPVRTSKNYNINNIKLDNINIPENIKDFDNVKVIGQFEQNDKDIELTYGLNEALTKLVNEKSNKNMTFMLDGKENKEIQIAFDFDSNNLTLIDNIEIIANENVKTSVIIKYKSDELNEYFHSGIIKLIAKQNAYIDVVILNCMNTNSNNLIAIENILEENANVNFTIIDIGGKNSITNYYSNLIGQNSNNNIKAIYLGKENQLFDLNYIAELRGEKTNIDIEVQGALRDNSKKHFKGTIDFKKGCKKAKGNENESCMLLSDTAKSLALPMLLCSEEDIEGNHSCSAGKIGEKELFYIMSRGFELKDAMNLMVKAKFNKILECINSEALKNEIIYEINMRLD